MTFATCSIVQMKWIHPLIVSDLMAEIQLWNVEMIACTVMAALSNDSAGCSGRGRGIWLLYSLLILFVFSFFLTQISRCLKPGGRFVSITFHSPFLRKRLYARTEYNWSIKKFSYDGGFEYFVYVMTKGEELSPEDAALEKKLLDDAKSPPAKVTTLHTEPDEDFLSNIDL